MDDTQSVTVTGTAEYHPYHPLRAENGERIDTGGEGEKEGEMEENPTGY